MPQPPGASVHAVRQSLSWRRVLCVFLVSFLGSSGSTLEVLHRGTTGRTRGGVSVGRDGASAQAAARQALEDAHGDVHEGPKVEEQVVEGVDGQAAGLVGVLQRHDGRVQAVGQVPEARAVGFNHLFNALGRKGERESVGMNFRRVIKL